MRHNKDMDDAKRLSILQEYLSSSSLKEPFEREKGIGKGSISRWLRIFAIEDKPQTVKVVLPMNTENDSKIVTDSDSEIARLRQELKAKDLELKRVTMARDAYEKMIEIAEEKYAIPIRKNSDAK